MRSPTPEATLPHATPGDLLSVLEVVASEHPRVVPAVVRSLARSPARSALLELLSLFQVKAPEEIAGAAVSVARQLDRLERHPRWTEPREVLGDTAVSAIVLDAFARHRADRWRSTRGEIPPPLLVRTNRRLRNAAGLERARALVHGFLE